MSAASGAKGKAHELCVEETEKIHGELERLDALGALLIEHANDCHSTDPVTARRFSRLVEIVAERIQAAHANVTATLDRLAHAGKGETA